MAWLESFLEPGNLPQLARISPAGKSIAIGQALAGRSRPRGDMRLSSIARATGNPTWRIGLEAVFPADASYGQFPGLELYSVSEAADIETLDIETHSIEEESKMSGQILVPPFAEAGLPMTPARPRKPRLGGGGHFRAPAVLYGEEETSQRQAELFYLQKQIQSQTPMEIVLEDGETVEGCIEWYDRNTLKVRGRSRILVYKSAVKYMYKQGESEG